MRHAAVEVARLEGMRAAREEYRIRTSDPYIHYLSRKLALQAEIEAERRTYENAKAEADNLYLEAYTAVRDEFNYAIAQLKKEYKK